MADYNMDKLSKFMEVTSKSKNPPRYEIMFNVKDCKKSQEDLLAIAFKDAESQAKSIAKASGKVLKECLKGSFEPFDTDTHSQTKYEGEMMYKSKSYAGIVRENICNTFVPEDITLSATIYCHFITK